MLVEGQPSNWTAKFQRTKERRPRSLTAAGRGRAGCAAIPANTPQILGGSAKGPHERRSDQSHHQHTAATGREGTRRPDARAGLVLIRIATLLRGSVATKSAHSRPGSQGPRRRGIKASRECEHQSKQRHRSAVAHIAKRQRNWSKSLVFRNIRAPDIPTPGIAPKAAQYWTTLALGMVSLMVLRSGLRPLAPVGPVAARRTAWEPEPPQTSRAAATSKLQALATHGSPSARDEVSNWCRRPDAAANILRAWIGSVS